MIRILSSVSGRPKPMIPFQRPIVISTAAASQKRITHQRQCFSRRSSASMPLPFSIACKGITGRTAKGKQEQGDRAFREIGREPGSAGAAHPFWTGRWLRDGFGGGRLLGAGD